MTIEELSPRDWAALFGAAPTHAFNRPAFLALNAAKAERLRWLVLRDTKARFGLVLGERGGRLLSPFSAPYGGPVWLSAQGMAEVEAACEALAAYAVAAKMPVRLTLPPLFHDTADWSKWVVALSHTARTVSVEPDHYIPLAAAPAPWDRKAAARLRQALARGHELQALAPTADNLARCYGLIKAHHEAKGYPVAMTRQQVADTMRVVGVDLFALTIAGEDAAAAIVFHAAPGIRQAIYWANRPGAEPLHPMHLLAHHLCAHYRAAGARVFDLGPSALGGLPNLSLCAFKESIGGATAAKFTFEMR